MSTVIRGSKHSTGQGWDHDPELHLRWPLGHLCNGLIDVCLLHWALHPRDARLVARGLAFRWSSVNLFGKEARGAPAMGACGGKQELS